MRVKPGGPFPGATILLALILLLGAGWLRAEDKVVFVDEPVAPYCYGELGGEATGGITSELLAELFGRLGLDFEIQLLPWARVLKTVEHGKADGIPLLMKNAEREAFLAYTDPVVENRELFYYLPERLGDFQWDTFQDIQGLKLGLITGYIYNEEFLRAVEQQHNPVVYSQDVEANFRLLLAGRVDLTLEDETLAQPVLAEHPDWAAQVRTAERPVSSYYWYMGISKLSPLAARMDEINSVLNEMRDDGSLEAILGRN